MISIAASRRSLILPYHIVCSAAQIHGIKAGNQVSRTMPMLKRLCPRIARTTASRCAVRGCRKEMASPHSLPYAAKHKGRTCVHARHINTAYGKWAEYGKVRTRLHLNVLKVYHAAAPSKEALRCPVPCVEGLICRHVVCTVGVARQRCCFTC